LQFFKIDLIAGAHRPAQLGSVRWRSEFGDLYQSDIAARPGFRKIVGEHRKSDQYKVKKEVGNSRKDRQAGESAVAPEPVCEALG
jgi:hypothetical protein